MKNWRKFMAAALILTLMIALAGCGSEALEKVADEVVSAVEEADAPVSLGRIEGNVYINEYVGYRCTLNSDWEFYSAEVLQELPEDVAEMLGDSEFVEEYDLLSQITDMMAENVTDLQSINVLYQKLDMTARLASISMNEEDIIDGILEESRTMTDAYAQAGIIVDRFEKVTVNFLGEERFAIRTYASIQDIPYFTLQLYDYHLGNYAVTTTLASYVEDTTDSMLALFSAAE